MTAQTLADRPTGLGDDQSSELGACGGESLQARQPVQVSVDDGELAVLDDLLDEPPGDTPYVGQHYRREPRAPGSRASRMWAAISVVFAVVGILAVAVLPRMLPPQDSGSVRVDDPLAVVEPPSAAAGGPAALEASAPVRVRIPALGVTSGIVELGLDGKGSLQVPQDAQVAGWFEGGPTPGEVGGAVLAGHVDWHGARGAFYGLLELRAGDRIVVDRADGTVATFSVDRVEEHRKSDFPTEAVYGDIDHAGLRLITCGGAFDEDTGDYRDNVIVFASLAFSG